MCDAKLPLNSTLTRPEIATIILKSSRKNRDRLYESRGSRRFSRKIGTSCGEQGGENPLAYSTGNSLLCFIIIKGPLGHKHVTDLSHGLSLILRLIFMKGLINKNQNVCFLVSSNSFNP